MCGFNVTADSLAQDAIDRVGPGGHYLVDTHTLCFMRSELFFPSLADRQNRPLWELSGMQDTRTRAVARLAKLRRDHQPPGPPPDLDRTIRDRFRIPQ
jgi:trimethylamine--corrinoid protein Co-methyltransferase